MSKILVIDDRPTNREFLVTLLGYGGNLVFEAGDGLEGLKLAIAEKPDLVIADIVMPTMDGYEFVRLLRDAPAIAATPVIFYTASYLEAAAHKLAETCGVQRVLIKPADPEEILAAVAEALGSRLPSPAPVLAESFAREHLNLVTNKLAEKVDELEALNGALEGLVKTRTAELAAANEDLRGLNRIKDEFLAVVSHDLRSPLSGIEMMSELLKGRSETTSPADFDHGMETINEAARHLLALVNDLLDIAKIESGHANLELAEVKLGEVIGDSARALTFNAQCKGIKIKLDAPAEDLRIKADRLKLSQIFSNLIGNAIKFTLKGGEVWVRLMREPAEVVVQVIDTGQGIPAEGLTGLFEKFGKKHRVGTAGERGTGLGLSIVRQLVELHGGSIAVASKVGSGSTFTVRLPAPVNPPEMVA